MVSASETFDNNVSKLFGILWTSFLCPQLWRSLKAYWFGHVCPLEIGWNLMYEISIKISVPIFLCPQLRRSCGSILVSGCPCVSSAKTVHAWVLKFHIRIPHGKIADTHFFSCASCLPFWSYAPLKKSEWNLVSKISRKVFELGAWNLVSW